jgi:predicted DNA-binding antitoxin AbrB/MazE fold protein
MPDRYSRRALELETRYLEAMSALRARVENGRLKLDEPTDLPEGQVIELIPLDEVISTEGDDLDEEERAALHRSIDESIDDERAGNVEDLSKIIAELRAQL